MRYSGQVFIGAVFFLGQLSFGAQIYSITNLGAGGVIAINDAGQVLGSDTRGSYLHSNGAKQYLPQPQGGSFVPRALNDLGEVAGYVTLPSQYSYTLATYQSGVLTVTGLGGLDPTAINNSGQIVGAEVFTYQGFTYSNGTVTTIGPLPYDVNAAGVAVGTTLENNRRAFFYGNGQVSYLAPPGAVSAEAYAINDVGEVVGNFSPIANLVPNQIFIYAGGHYQELGYALNGNFEEDGPSAVNNSGLIVGTAQTTSGLFAWAYDPVFGYSNLNSVVNAPGWVLQIATDVSDQGQIVGTGTFNGQRTSFLLTPIPEPRQWAAILIGFAMIFPRLRK